MGEGEGVDVGMVAWGCSCLLSSARSLSRLASQGSIVSSAAPTCLPSSTITLKVAAALRESLACHAQTKTKAERGEGEVVRA
jgi:hypothetical protein